MIKVNMMFFFLLVTQAYSDKVKKYPSAPNRSRTYDLPISTSRMLYHDMSYDENEVMVNFTGDVFFFLLVIK